MPARRLFGSRAVVGVRASCIGRGSRGVLGTAEAGVAGVCGVESVPVRPPHCPHVAVSKDGERAPPEAVAVDTAAATAAAFFLPFLRGWYRYSGYRSRCFLFSSYQAGWSTSSSIRLGLSEQTSACFSHISFISCEHCLHISPIILEISGLGLPGFWATTAAWLCCRNNINAGSNVSPPKLKWKKETHVRLPRE